MKTLGKKLGSALNAVRQAFEELSKSHEAVATFLAEAESKGSAKVAGHELQLEDLMIERGPKDERLIATQSGVTVLLDTKLTPELIHEGFAREVVNRIQTLRKDSGLNVSDRIKVAIEATGELADAVRTSKTYITSETLTTDLTLGPVSALVGDVHRVDIEIDEHKAVLALVVV